MNILPDDIWQRVLPKLRASYPRLSELDLVETQHRIDLIIAKIQNRHWISRSSARYQVLALLKSEGVALGI